LACNVFGDGHTACDVQSAVSRPQDGAEKPRKRARTALAASPLTCAGPE